MQKADLPSWRETPATSPVRRNCGVIFLNETNPLLLCMGLFSLFFNRRLRGTPSGLDPRPAVAAEQMQLLAPPRAADLRPGRGRLGAGNADDDLAGRKLAGVGGDALLVL